MKAKLKDYIDTIFTDAPQTYRAYELKEEMYTDLCEKYDDLISEGKTPAAAYHAVISGVGDISELIKELKSEAGVHTSESGNHGGTPPRTERAYTPEEQETIRKYRSRGAIMTAISVAMYTICWLPLVILGALWDDVGGIVGLVIMFLFIAVATALNIIHGMTKPECLRNGNSSEDDDDDDNEDRDTNSKKGSGHPVYKAISSALWCLTVVVYLGVSFLSGAWHITWLIFLIVTAIDNIIKACFDLKS